MLKLLAPLGSEAVAQILERDTKSVDSKAGELKIAMKGSDQDVDLQLVPARLLQWVKESPELQICPMCGRRLAMMKSTGLCRPCHLDRLIDLRQEQLEVIARGKRLTKLRQAKKRMRICESCGDAFYPRTSTPDKNCSKCGERNA